MYTSFGILALAGFLVAPAPTPRPDLVWSRDYQVAQSKGVKEHKPLAVFVGAGQGGYQQLVQDGPLDDTVTSILAEKYVCVYLDASSPAQQALIESLAVTKGHGLVLSDRSGGVQAFHYDGQIAQAELTRHLQHFAEPAVEVRTTLSNTTPRISYYPSDSSHLRPAQYAPAFSSRSC